MVMFFFVVGLEIKREVLVGELSSIGQASLPALAALGGMIVPAIIYVSINQTGPAQAGWGIPMATDIAFSLGCLVALGRLVPTPLKVFLLALAIFDDMGAIMVIAIFYTEQVKIISLTLGVLILLMSIVLNLRGVRKTYPYALLGLALWLAFLLSGIHATIAGVLLAFTIPGRSISDQKKFRQQSQAIIEEFPEKDFNIMMVDPLQRKLMNDLVCACEDLDTPLQRLEYNLYPLVSYIVLPIFALANAGVNLAEGTGITGLFNSISLGIILGLMVGKPLGITLFTWLSVKLGLSALPEGANWTQILGTACLAGIGFTMSLFVTNLAFQDPVSIYNAKLAVICGSIVSASLGITIIGFSAKGRS
ncbi:MAG: Na+/H+ antiporter NhaA [Syntrophomonadaceae bacterium]|nr:Na+/H+ antiporter NhaA [Syntrophomonadaceae bacterium]